MKNVYKISEVRAKPVLRASTGFQELDWLYGCSTFPNGSTQWGIPQGKISLWSGESGVGKSRAAIQLASSYAKAGVKVLYFQNEVDVSTFAGWVKQTSGLNSSQLNSFVCSDVKTLGKMIEAIYYINPEIVIVDSVNEIDEFETGSKQQARLIIEGKTGHRGFRDACLEVKCHVILLSQLNQDGSIKGGTSLPHLVDIAFKLQHYQGQNGNLFTIRVGIKHRYGRTGNKFYSVWEHSDSGIDCVSDYSLEDDRWCLTHGIAIRDMKTYYESLPDYSGYVEEVAPKKKHSFLFRCLFGDW